MFFDIHPQCHVTARLQMLGECVELGTQCTAFLTPCFSADDDDEAGVRVAQRRGNGARIALGVVKRHGRSSSRMACIACMACRCMATLARTLMR